MITESRIAALRSSHPTVVAAGSYIMDVFGRPVAELPRGQNGLLLDEIRATPAGTAGGTARLGASVIAAGAIGHDLAGDFVIASLQSQGVDASHLRRKHDVPTSRTMLPIHPDGSRPAWHVPGANSTFELADFLGVRGDDAEAVIAPVLPHVDIFMPNEGEALAVAGDPDCITAARRLRDLGARCVIIKRGPDGCLIVDEDGARTFPADDARVVDTTGCGDAFCAGVIVATCAGWPIDESARLGCATGALNLRALGSDAGARDVDEAVAYMRDARPWGDPTTPGDPTLGELVEAG